MVIGAAGAKDSWNLTQKSQFLSGNIYAMLIFTFPLLTEESKTSQKANEDRTVLSL